MNKFICLLAFCILASQSKGQSCATVNLTFASQTNPEPGGNNFSDVWGWNDGFKEYAVLGSRTSVYFYDVTNASSPLLMASFTGGANSTWRDFKHYEAANGNHYIYSVTEGNEGLTIYDVTAAPTINQVAYQIKTEFSTAHNVFIDQSKGKLYLPGTNTRSNGLIVLDVAANPINPPVIGNVALPGGYVHDVFVRNDTAYCSHGNNGLYVYNFVNAAAPVLLGNLTTYADQGYNHSSWLTDNGKYLVFCDETHGRTVKMCDVSDLTDIKIADNFISTFGPLTDVNRIAHNPFIKGNKVYISYYHDGVQVFDISNPTNVTACMGYDTYAANTNYTGFSGNWGTYPFLPSGSILASDRFGGLFVLQETVIALPVSCTNLEAAVSNNEIELTWSTESETENLGFHIERSYDGISFEVIGWVDGAMNSNESIDYTFQDRNIEFGVNYYYRLLQEDMDGSSEVVCETVHIQPIGSLNHGFDLHPNPSSGGVVLTVQSLSKEKLEIKVLSMEGKLINNTSINLDEGLNTIPLNLQEISVGMYIVEISNGTIQHHKRLLKQ